MDAISQHFRPNNIAVAFDDCMSRSQSQRFFGIESGMYSAENHPSAPFPDRSADLITAQSVSCVDTNANHIARFNL